MPLKGSPGYRKKPSALKREHPAFLFLWVFLPSWIRIQIANPDPDPIHNT
jgi:hypothetical protein